MPLMIMEKLISGAQATSAPTPKLWYLARTLPRRAEDTCPALPLISSAYVSRPRSRTEARVNPVGAPSSACQMTENVPTGWRPFGRRGHRRRESRMAGSNRPDLKILRVNLARVTRDPDCGLPDGQPVVVVVHGDFGAIACAYAGDGTERGRHGRCGDRHGRLGRADPLAPHRLRVTREVPRQRGVEGRVAF